MSKSMLLKPRISEKTYALSQSGNVYVFNIPRSANKMIVAQSVAEQFKVTVTNVNIARSVGKAKRTVRRGGRATAGKRADTKRAYVTIKSGETIPVFAGVEDDKSKSTQAEQKKATRGTSVVRKGAK